MRITARSTNSVQHLAVAEGFQRISSAQGEVLMVELNGSVEVENPAEALRNQNGIFRVTSPDGQVFQVTCRTGSNMHIREIGESERMIVSEPKRWQIQKMQQPIA